MDNFSHIVVFRTGKIYEFDLVLNQLDAEGIPTFTQNQTSSGLRLATPATLTGDAGSWWTIGVPEEYIDQAKEIISELPCDQITDPEVWDFATSKSQQNLKFIYRTLAVIGIVFSGYSLIDALIGIIK